jgi:hypothetical protein
MATRLKFARVEDSIAVMAGLSGNTAVKRVDDVTIEIESDSPRDLRRTLRNVQSFTRDVEVVWP